MCNRSRTQRNFLTLAVRMLKREMPDIRLLVSYADLNQGYEGRIYQASNWVFVGKTGFEAGIMLKGKLTHRRTINSKYGTSDIGWLQHHVDPSAARYEGKPKYKYLPLDGDIVERLKQLSKPYPKMRRKRRHRCARLPVWERPGKHRARRSNHESYWNASTFGGIVLF